MKTRCPLSRGFTLVELLVTIAVVAILSAIALPSFTHMIQRNEVSSASNRLLADLGYARSEAATRGTYVSVCPSDDGTSCADGAAWESGWIVYTYAPGHAKANTDFDEGDDANLLLRYTTARQAVSVQGSADDTVLTFGTQGEMKPDAATFSFATCYRGSESGTGHSTASVPGIGLNVQASGGAQSSNLAAEDSACVP
jgi:type IV fimbrial biogenesis protein FimT